VPAAAGAALTADSLAVLHSLLLSELSTQAARVAESRATLAAVAGQFDIDSVFERESAEGALSQAEAAMRDVRHALGRLDLGTYGMCEGCARPIPFARLEAIPHTRRCVSCPAERSGFLG
jgi:RNA polymerase-binding transcription factor DksA